MKHIAALSILAVAAALTAQAQVTHQLHVLDDEFDPPTLIIELGDAVHIIFDDADHTFTQVSQATWESNGATPLPGGYRFGEGTPNPGVDFTITPMALGPIYYVCEHHIQSGMKGTISVITTVGMEDPTMQEGFRFAPNPANDRVELMGQEPMPVMVMVYDATGKVSMVASPDAGDILHVGTLNEGIYFAEIRDRDQRLLSRQRLVVAR